MLHYSEAKVRWEYSVVKARGRIGAVESLCVCGGGGGLIWGPHPRSIQIPFEVECKTKKTTYNIMY